MQMIFPDLAAPVDYQDCDDIATNIMAVLCGWNARTDAETGSLSGSWPDPVMKLTKDADGYRRTSPWTDPSSLFTDPVNATCDLAADLIQAYAHDNDLLCLHAAAIDFGGRLAVFPDTYRQGKSTLSAHLAHQGQCLFSDDVLPIEKDGTQGVAIGILPRVRLPLPETVDATFADFVKKHSVIANHKYCYFGACETHAAPLGKLAPIGTIIMLNRKDGNATRLNPAKGSDTLARLIEQNFAKTVPAPDTLDQLHEIVVNADCYVLDYGEGDDAARFLIKEFG